MKTVKQIDSWIANEVMTAYKRIPGDVVTAARQTGNNEILYDHISRHTGIRGETVREVIGDRRRAFFTDI